MSSVQALPALQARSVAFEPHWRGNVPRNFNFVNYRKTRFYLIQRSGFQGETPYSVSAIT